MIIRNTLLLLLLALSGIFHTVAMDNGLARTPPMGWLSWMRYTCEIDCKSFPDNCINEELYMRMADALVSDGYAAAGYNYINIDDCWLAKNRTADGKLQADPDRFPSGIKRLADYVHARGLKLGLYECVGSMTCGEYPGLNVPTTSSFEEDLKSVTSGDGAVAQYIVDIETMTSWGIDSLKIDGCFADPHYMNITYPKVSKALNMTGRPVVYYCSWAFYVMYNKMDVPWDLLQEYCNGWRIWFDINDTWQSISNTLNFWAVNNSQLSPVPRPGGWHDADQILVGDPGLSLAQATVQMVLWSIWTSPLLMSNDLYNVQPEEKELLQNPDLIAINQDPLGKAGVLVNSTGTQTEWSVWARELANGDVAVAMVRDVYYPIGGPAYMHFTPSLIGLKTSYFSVRDVLARSDVGMFKDFFEAQVMTTSCRLFRVTPLSPEQVTDRLLLGTPQLGAVH